MDEMMTQAYMGVFLDELDEQLQVLDEMLLVLEQTGNDPATIQTIFRAAHTMKGSSAAMGFERMKELTHRVETVFELLRSNRIPLHANLMNTLFGCIDYLKRQRELFLRGEYEERPIDPLLLELDRIGRGEPLPGAIYTESASADDEREPANTAPAGGSEGREESIYAVCFTMHPQTPLPAARAMLLLESLKEIGDMVVSYPTPEELAVFEEGPLGEINCVLATCLPQAEIERLLQTSEVDRIELQKLEQEQEAAAASAAAAVPAPQRETPRAPFAVQASPGQASLSAGRESLLPEVKLASQTVRVDVHRLEHLINLVGELIIDQTRLQEVAKQLRGRLRGGSEVELLEDIMSHVSRVIGELQEGMMKTRMLPIEQLFSRFPRLVRDLSVQSGKEIQLVLEGKETELDRSLIEEISDPLIHMLRNAADHGLEPAEERIRLGKPPEGKITLRAFHQENAIVITIADDGRGIDPAKTKRKAIEQRLLTEEEAAQMSEKELVSLIFHSGLSTAEQVTELSGRGVGMDIVRAHIEKLNGLIDIDTTLGLGTVFTIKLPLTLAIIRSLLVEAEGRTFAIPLVNVVEIFRVRADELKTLHGQEVCKVRGDIVPAIRLNRLLNLPEPAAADPQEVRRYFSVVIGMAEKRVCLLVDRPVANQEIVMKSLGAYVGQVPYVAGSTILGNGDIAIILDAGSIIREAGTLRSLREDGPKTGAGDRKQECKAVTLRVQEKLYALEIDKIKEIIPTPAITRMVAEQDRIAGMIQLRGSSMPVYDIAQCLGLAAKSNPEEGKVLIVDAGERDIGLLVDQVTEVLTIPYREIEAPPKTADGTPARFVQGVGRHGDSLLVFLNLDDVLTVS